jgi:hypothetical protein
MFGELSEPPLQHLPTVVPSISIVSVSESIQTNDQGQTPEALSYSASLGQS